MIGKPSEIARCFIPQEAIKAFFYTHAVAGGDQNNEGVIFVSVVCGDGSDCVPLEGGSKIPVPGCFVLGAGRAVVFVVKTRDFFFVRFDKGGVVKLRDCKISNIAFGKIGRDVKIGGGYFFVPRGVAFAVFSRDGVGSDNGFGAAAGEGEGEDKKRSEKEA